MPGSMKAMRLYHLLLGNGLTGANLDAELGNHLYAGAFEASLRQVTVVENLKASPSALVGIAASGIALDAVIRNAPKVFDAIIANSAALAALVASSSAMDVIAASSVAKTACYNSDALLTAIAESITAVSAMRAAAQYSVKTAIENGVTNVALGWPGTYIVLGASRSTAGARVVSLTPLRAGSAVANTIALDAVADSLARDANVAIPISAAATFALNTAGAGQIYFGALRCDI